MDAIGAGLAPRIGERDWKDVWRDSPEYQKALQDIEQVKKDGLAKPVVNTHKATTCEQNQTFRSLVMAAYRRL